MEYDLVIRNGRVIDGSGLPSFVADVGIRDDRVIKVGRIRDRAQSELDAEGSVVCPGFIDGHTHLDAQIFWDPMATPSSSHGVTSVVMGNCGFSLAPIQQGQQELVIRDLERAEDIPRSALDSIGWQWQSFADFLDVVDELPKGINVAANVGHSALRTSVMGERAYGDSATDDDLLAMGTELKGAIEAGAIGLTTTRNEHHETSDGRPVASRFSSSRELEQLVSLLGKSGKGLLEITPQAGFFSTFDPERSTAHSALQRLAISSGVPITFPVRPIEPDIPSSLQLLDKTAEQGGKMIGQTHSRGIGMVLSFEAHLPFDGLPEWSRVRSEPLERQKVLLKDENIRARLVAEAHQASYGVRVGPSGLKPRFDEISVFDHATKMGTSISDLAILNQEDPVLTMIRLGLASEFKQLFLQPIHSYSRQRLLEALKHQRTVMTFSDAGAHISQISDCSIQTYFLAHWVREEQEFSLEEAVRMLTLVPAQTWGLSDRGVVREGCIADVNIFNPDHIGPKLPKVVHDVPGGGIRFWQGAEGISATIVAGQVVCRDGQPTGALPGRLLRRNGR